MTQPRGGTAVMASRKEPHDSLDYFPTPPWATRALIAHVLVGGGWGAHQLGAMSVWEPACGEGHMVRPLRERFSVVMASDVHDYGWRHHVQDFLFPMKSGRPDFVITNPPFRLAVEFIERGLEIAQQGVAVLVRSTFLEGGDRYKRLFSHRPPAMVAPFVERVLMTKGKLLDPDKLHPVMNPKTGQIEMKKITTATAYSWLVWYVDGPAIGGPRVRWIPPCRKALTCPGDYVPVQP